MTAATKKSLRPACSAKVSSEPTRISATSAVTRWPRRARRGPLETSPANWSLLPCWCGSGGGGGCHGRARVDRSRTMPAGIVAIATFRSGSPCEPGIDGTRKSVHRPATSPRRDELDAGRSAPPAEGEREPEHEEQIGDDAPGERAAHDIGARPRCEQGDDHSGALPKLALRNPPML